MKYLRILVVIAFIIYQGFQTYTFLKIQSGDELDTRCGTVTFKGNRDQVHKYSSETKFVMVILYDDTHQKEDENVRAAILPPRARFPATLDVAPLYRTTALAPAGQ